MHPIVQRGLSLGLALVGLSHASPAAPAGSLKREVVTQYAAIASASYKDSLAAARQLQQKIEAMVASPSGPALEAARRVWLAARVPYLQTEAFRFYDGPIDDVEGGINAWPIDEHYVDYVEGEPDAGVINQVRKFPRITRELIVSLNEREGEKNISTGFHAIEFLLWGQDFSTNGPGDRPWQDFTDETKHASRRCEYLRLAAALLVDNLKTVTAAWEEGVTNNYRAEWVALDPDEALGRILKGIGALSGPELAGERLTVPYETKEQEDEHSCFSDNTHNDVIYNVLGVQNIYLGRYTRTDGTKIQGASLRDLLAQTDRAFADRLAAQIEASLSAARGIPVPFDQAILGINTSPGRVAIKKTFTSLQTQADLIARAAGRLSIHLTLQ
jgi:putative iron-regulated protein